MQHELEKLRYPIGRFAIPDVIDKSLLNDWIKTIADFPARLKSEVGDLTDDVLEKRYRPEGWTIRQVVHHCADSHMNSFVRFKLALTEEDPTIKLYEEKLWAELPDAKNIPRHRQRRVQDDVGQGHPCRGGRLAAKRAHAVQSGLAILNQLPHAALHPERGKIQNALG